MRTSLAMALAVSLLAVLPALAGEPAAARPAQVLKLKGDVQVTMTRGPGECSGCSGGMSVTAEVDGRKLRLGLAGECRGPCEALLRTNRQAVLKDLKPGRYEVFYDPAVFEFRLEALAPSPRECDRDSDCRVGGYERDPCSCPPCSRVKLWAEPVKQAQPEPGAPTASTPVPSCTRPTACPKCETFYEPEAAVAVCKAGKCELSKPPR